MTMSILSIATQFLRFGIVGGLATLVHSAGYVAFIEVFDVTPIFSNIFAFLVAVLVSFAGHSTWTFRHEYRDRSTSASSVFLKFGMTALLGLSLNTFFVFLAITLLALHYAWAIVFFVFVTPVIVYLVSKLWVFK